MSEWKKEYSLMCHIGNNYLGALEIADDLILPCPSVYCTSKIIKICEYSIALIFYDKGSYATWGNFPSMEWILVNIMITINCTDSTLCLVDSWYFKLSIDHHL